ncbi:MAG: CRISPR system precrRNA processing endoribonuclease RAMP protein Cas6, partial [Candidatus Electrothrix sp.]
MDTEERYPVGHSFTCELTLFGKADQFFPICPAALEFLGREMGLGQDRGKFAVEGVERACPLQSSSSSSSSAAAQSGSLTCQDIAESCLVPIINDITIHLPTRLRLKADGHLLSHVPEFHIFLVRLLGRMNTLSSLYGGGRMVELALRDQLISRARERIRLDPAGTDACWRELPRFSGRQQQWMKFGGLLGSVSWQGRPEDFWPFLPYLAIGEWIHVGGKSSFGLGKYVAARQGGG